MQAGREVGEGRVPAGFLDEFGVVDRITLIVAGAVVDVVKIIGFAAEFREDHPNHFEVVLLAVGPDEIGFADASLIDDLPHCGVVIAHMDPIAHLLAGSVDARADAVDHIRDRARDELLDVLVGAVVVRAV